MRKTLIGLAAAALALSAACGEPGLEDTLKLNDDPDSVLLIVKDEGGFVPIEFIVGQGPRLVLLRDGTLIVSGPQIEIFPQPLLPNYQSIQLDDETMLFVLEELDALGFADIDSEVNDEAANMVADASTTVTTFYNQDGPHTFSVYALGIDTPGERRPGADPRQSRQPPSPKSGSTSPASRTNGRPSRCWPEFPRSRRNRSLSMFSRGRSMSATTR